MTRKSLMGWRVILAGRISKKVMQTMVKHCPRMVLLPYSATIMDICPLSTHKFLASRFTHEVME